MTKKEGRQGLIVKARVPGISPIEPIETNPSGGKQSKLPYSFTMLPANAVIETARVFKQGAEKYGETVGNRNYWKLSVDEILNHALAHIFAYLAGDRSDDHLSHLSARALMALDKAMRESGEADVGKETASAT